MSGEHGFGAWADTILSVGNDRVAAHGNAAIAYNREHQLEMFGDVIAEVGRDWVVRPVAEAFIDRSRRDQGILGAARCDLGRGDDLAFDLAGRTAALDGGPVGEVRLGLTWSVRVWGG